MLTYVKSKPFRSKKKFQRWNADHRKRRFDSKKWSTPKFHEVGRSECPGRGWNEFKIYTRKRYSTFNLNYGCNRRRFTVTIAYTETVDKKVSNYLQDWTKFLTIRKDKNVDAVDEALNEKREMQVQHLPPEASWVSGDNDMQLAKSFLTSLLWAKDSMTNGNRRMGMFIHAVQPAPYTGVRGDGPQTHFAYVLEHMGRHISLSLVSIEGNFRVNGNLYLDGDGVTPIAAGGTLARRENAVGAFELYMGEDGLEFHCNALRKWNINNPISTGLCPLTGGALRSAIIEFFAENMDKEYNPNVATVLDEICVDLDMTTNNKRTTPQQRYVFQQLCDAYAAGLLTSVVDEKIAELNGDDGDDVWYIKGVHAYLKMVYADALVVFPLPVEPVEGENVAVVAEDMPPVQATTIIGDETMAAVADLAAANGDTAIPAGDKSE